MTFRRRCPALAGSIGGREILRCAIYRTAADGVEGAWFDGRCGQAQLSELWHLADTAQRAVPPADTAGCGTDSLVSCAGSAAAGCAVSQLERTSDHSGLCRQVGWGWVGVDNWLHAFTVCERGWGGLDVGGLGVCDVPLKGNSVALTRDFVTLKGNSAASKRAFVMSKRDFVASKRDFVVLKRAFALSKRDFVVSERGCALSKRACAPLKEGGEGSRGRAHRVRSGLSSWPVRRRTCPLRQRRRLR